MIARRKRCRQRKAVLTATSHRAADVRTDSPARSDLDLWQLLISAPTDELFCSAWLALLCRQMSEVTAGVVLLRSAGSNTFTPVALWPLAPRDMSHLGAVAEIALKENRGVVQRAGSGETPWHIAYPLGDAQQVIGTVALEIPASPGGEP